MAPNRRTSTDRGHRVENCKRAAHFVGSNPPRDVPRDAGRARGGRPPARRCGVLRAVPGPLPRCPRTPVGADRDVLAADVLEVPLSPGLRAIVPGGGRFDLVAAVLSDPAGHLGSAPDHLDEDHHAVRVVCRRWPERGAAGQGPWGQGLEDQQGPRRHHGGPRRRRLSDGLGSVGQGRGQDGQEHREAQGCRTGLEDPLAGPHPDDASPGPVHRFQPPTTQRRGKRRGHGHQRRDGPHREGRRRRGPARGGERSAGSRAPR